MLRRPGQPGSSSIVVDGLVEVQAVLRASPDSDAALRTVRRVRAAVHAAVLLLASVVLSFAATLGVSALVFDHVLDFPGADPSVPLYGFVFLVALGVDYNILLMSRVRERAPGTARGPGSAEAWPSPAESSRPPVSCWRPPSRRWR